MTKWSTIPPIGHADHLTLLMTPTSDTHNSHAGNDSVSWPTDTIDRKHSSITIRWFKVYDLRKSHMDDLYDQAGLIDWDSLLSKYSNVNDMWNAFYDLLSTLLQIYNVCSLPPSSNDQS